MFKVYINKDGGINKNIILEIHEFILNKLNDRDAFGWDYGYYIIRSFKFLEGNDIKICNNILDLFLSNITIFIKPETFINWIIIVREYVDIEIIQEQNTICSYCDNEIKKVSDGEYNCSNCGYVYDTRLPGVKDLDSINMCKTYYSLNSNLLSIMNKFMGIDVYISTKDMNRIKSEISKREIDIKNLKCIHITKILKDLKITNHYNDAYYIYTKLTNKRMINFKKYIPKILTLHNELEYTYRHHVRNPTRINSLNVQYKLIKLLQLCDINEDLSDLCTLKTEQKFEEHEEKWREICKITGWKYIP